MLKSLNITDFAVIRRLRMEFEEGLNLLTGETGSGKSIIVDALGLILGARSATDQIRTGERTASVEAIFELKGEDELAFGNALDAFGVQHEDEVIIRREIGANGKGRIYVNDKSVTLATLRSLQPFLVEIHGQGDQRSLLSAQSHLDMLDAFANCLELKRSVGRAFAGRRAAQKLLQALESERAGSERESDLLRFQLSEIESVKPRLGEDEELLAERKLLTHAERILQLGSSAYTELYESDGSVLARLASINRSVEELGEIDARAASLTELLQTSVAALQEVSDALRRYGEALEFDPARLAEIEERLTMLERLKHKYKTDLRGVIEIQDELSRRLNSLGNTEERVKALRASFDSAQAEYISYAKQLTECRRRAAEMFERRVTDDLRHVALERAEFVVQIETAKIEDETCGVPANGSLENSLSSTHSFFTQNGAERVEFLLSANPGEKPKPLSRVASGGELSRLMLTLRTVGMNERASAQQASETVVFDEIDVGIGGRVAEAVGRRLKMLAQTRQVLCVTHQPQIARFADHHFLVEKVFEDERTVTLVKRLSAEERVGELSRMIGGETEAVTTREAARWLLGKQASKGEPQPVRRKRRNSS